MEASSPPRFAREAFWCDTVEANDRGPSWQLPPPSILSPRVAALPAPPAARAPVRDEPSSLVAIHRPLPWGAGADSRP